MTTNPQRRVAVIGGGPAGLMAAETLAAAGVTVDVYDAMANCGRKFLIAGKGGLNLTHGESFEPFVSRYGTRAAAIRPMLESFGADQLRDWAKSLGVETFIGSSNRVFPSDLKAAPLLRGWLRRLRESGVHFHLRHRWAGWFDDGALRFSTPAGEVAVAVDAVVLALGGGSWRRLGSDGRWVPLLTEKGVDVAPLAPSNCGFESRWSDILRSRCAGQPVKPVAARLSPEQGGDAEFRQGEFIITGVGVEGSLIYALSPALREAISAHGVARLELDLMPGVSLAAISERLAKPRGSQSMAKHLHRAGIDGVKASLLRECAPEEAFADPASLAAQIKTLTVPLHATRPIDDAISTAGGVRFEALDARLMVLQRPGTFCAGEMLDWEAPTGGYLLTACFASGRTAAQGALDWLARSGSHIASP
nr:TIGR03862 family flavoprotein [Nevskia sp.]